MDAPTPVREIPHYARFARALTLASALGAAATTSACCPVIPESVACAHCTCSGQTRTLSQPLSCDTIHRDTECCAARMPVPGPLPPPDLVG